MEPDKNTSPENNSDSSNTEPQAPADALSRTPEDLEEERVEAAKAAPPTEPTGEKKLSPIKKLFRKLNVYFLLFLLVLVIVGVITAINFFNSQKPQVEAAIENQELTEDALKQLANTNTSIGNTSQTLTIQGNTVISGQTLMRGNLSVAGNFQTGGSIQGSSVTVSGEANLGETQASQLQVEGDLAVQGGTTLRNLNISGPSTFSGPMTASQITASRLILSGNAELRIPNHISFTGPSPTRGGTGPALGNGGSASVSGSDTTGTINVNTGGSPQSGCFVRINFNQTFSNRPHVIVSPVGSGAGLSTYYVDRDQSGFSVCAASPAPANRAFAFDYFVTN